jgi:hypothetical protein
LLWVVLWFELRALLEEQVLCPLNHTSSSFCSGYFGDWGVSGTICLDWPQTVILPISASKVARIIGMSHQHPNALILNKEFQICSQVVSEILISPKMIAVLLLK